MSINGNLKKYNDNNATLRLERQTILLLRERIKRKTFENRRLQHRKTTD